MTNNLPDTFANDPAVTPSSGLTGGFAARGGAGDQPLLPPEKTFPVLVVDDNPVDQELVAVQLGAAWPLQRALALEFAADGAEALAKLRLKDFALVILDWTLPVLGEGELLWQLRQHWIGTPVVVISGAERGEIPADLDALQAAFLNKSQMNPDTLRFAIVCALGLVNHKWDTATLAQHEP